MARAFSTKVCISSKDMQNNYSMLKDVTQFGLTRYFVCLSRNTDPVIYTASQKAEMRAKYVFKHKVKCRVLSSTRPPTQLKITLRRQPTVVTTFALNKHTQFHCYESHPLSYTGSLKRTHQHVSQGLNRSPLNQNYIFLRGTNGF